MDDMHDDTLDPIGDEEAELEADLPDTEEEEEEDAY